MSSISPPQPTEDYKRLQLIEQKVILCVQIAAQVTEHFSRVGRMSELAGPIQQLCTNFMNTIAEALQLAKEGAEASSWDHRLELHAYHSLARAHINTEKLQVLRLHLDTMQADLEAAVARPAETAEGGSEAVGTGAHAEAGPKQQPGNGGTGFVPGLGAGGESLRAVGSSGDGGGERGFQGGTSLGGSIMMEE
ncbi:hypothetical protein VaNZ11_000722 [Volvox africanus]|uniref:Mediator complex subunit 11 n=1 Tax=Volvox africanus TaxID=51714 RepID=A0ABQ5RN00_9CHLO|nr:hypothetical protein VaNZ11_000722 [Volvox africanus]